jgi:DNA-binding CsgD family transcriptional regulator
MERVTLAAEWVRTTTELEERALGDGRRGRAVLMVVAAEHDRTDPQALAHLARRLLADVDARASSRASSGEGRRTYLHDAFGAYCSHRELSPRQERLLALYLRGNNDKAIAAAFGCSESTVYEHWRRMARKADGYHKGDVVADFHRFLAGANEHADGLDT